MDDRSGTIPEKREPWGRYSLSDRKFTEITELVTKVILHFRTLFCNSWFSFIFVFRAISTKSNSCWRNTATSRNSSILKKKDSRLLSA